MSIEKILKQLSDPRLYIYRLNENDYKPIYKHECEQELDIEHVMSASTLTIRMYYRCINESIKIIITMVECWVRAILHFLTFQFLKK